MKVGFSKMVDQPDELATEIFKAQKAGVAVLSFGEFSRLVVSRRTTEKTQTLPESIANFDPVLCMTNAELQRTQTDSFTPSDVRHLRRAFLLKEYNLSIAKKILHEEEALNYFPHKENVSVLDYADYISRFFKRELEPFFSEMPFEIPIAYLKRHAYISAGSGHGKSELTKQLVHCVMASGHSAIVLDPHGKMAEEIARWKEFSDDPERLVYFNPYAMGSDLSCVPVINPLSGLRDAAEIDKTIEGLISGLTAVIDVAKFTARMKTILKPCLYTFAAYGKETTLHDLLDFLSGGEKAEYWKNQGRKTLKNKAMRETLEDFDSSKYKDTIGSIVDRLRVVLGSNALDACLVGPSSIDLAHAMNTGKVIVFNLEVGEETSAAFGRFIVSALVTLARQRKGDNDGEKRPVFLFLDEADRFMTEAIPVIYKETRKYGLYLTLVQQIVGFGLSSDTMNAITGNSALRVSGNVGGSEDCARTMSKIVKVEVPDIEALRPLDFWMKYGNSSAKKFSLAHDLLGKNNAMSEDDWKAVLEAQKRLYYGDKAKRAGEYGKTGETPPGAAKKELNHDYI